MDELHPDRRQQGDVDRTEAQLGERDEEVTVELPVADGKTRAWLHEHGRIISEKSDDETRWIVVRLGARATGRLRRMMTDRPVHGTLAEDGTGEAQ